MADFLAAFLVPFLADERFADDFFVAFFAVERLAEDFLAEDFFADFFAAFFVAILPPYVGMDTVGPCGRSGLTRAGDPAADPHTRAREAAPGKLLRFATNVLLRTGHHIERRRDGRISRAALLRELRGANCAPLTALCRLRRTAGDAGNGVVSSCDCGCALRGVASISDVVRTVEPTIEATIEGCFARDAHAFMQSQRVPKS